jgi:hypothetical protein
MAIGTQQDTNRDVAQNYPPPPARRSAHPFVVSSVICSIAAIFFLPIILGPIGAVLGFVGYGRGDRKGLWAGIFGIVATVAGMILAAAVLHARHHTG